MALPIDVLPHPGVLSSCSTFTQCYILDNLFERSEAIHAELLPLMRSTAWASYEHFVDGCRATLHSLARSDANRQQLLAILGSHPRLASKEPIESAHSQSEQASLQRQDREYMTRLNEQYEQTFPGLRYVIFVNGRSVPQIAEDCKARIERGSYNMELETIVNVSHCSILYIELMLMNQAMCDIALDRLKKYRVVDKPALKSTDGV
jgi:2-oxo-4-hydroxy-4-carboxy--5-ureidoimidazoline (OHCU) decarboxylase